jgi:hypothetical protein
VALVGSLTAEISQKTFQTSLGWIHYTYDSVKSEIEPRAQDVLLREALAAASYKVVTDYGLEHLDISNNTDDALSAMQESGEEKDTTQFWEARKSASASEYMLKHDFEGISSDAHQVFCVEHKVYGSKQFVIISAPVADDGGCKVSTKFFCTCGDSVKDGVPCRHFLCVYGVAPQCGFHAGLCHPMWWSRNRGVYTTDEHTSFPLYRVSLS